MDSSISHIKEYIIDPLYFWDLYNFTNKICLRDLFSSPIFKKDLIHIFNVHKSHDIIHRMFVNRESAMGMTLNSSNHFLKSGFDIESNNFGSRNHYLFNRDISKAKNAGDHISLSFLNNSTLHALC